MEDNKKNNNMVYFALIIAFMLVILAVSLIANRSEVPENGEPNNNTEEVEEGEESEEVDETEEIAKEEIDKSFISKKEYTFDGKKLDLLFYKYAETYYYTDGDKITYTSLVVDIKKDDKVLFENNEAVAIIDDTYTEEDINDDINTYVSNIDYFSDTNGKKYIVEVGIGTGGRNYSVLNLDTADYLFGYSLGEFSNYDHKSFKELEKKLKIDLSKYFKNNRKSLVIDHKLLGYFKLDYDKNELDYIEVQVKDGKVDAKTTVIKSNLTEGELQSPILDIFSSVEEE